jgi:hypothetical protein
MNYMMLKVSEQPENQIGDNSSQQVFAAKPVKGPIDHATLRRDIMKRYSKTIAYLAK